MSGYYYCPLENSEHYLYYKYTTYSDSIEFKYMGVEYLLEDISTTVCHSTFLYSLLASDLAYKNIKYVDASLEITITFNTDFSKQVLNFIVKQKIDVETPITRGRDDNYTLSIPTLNLSDFKLTTKDYTIDIFKNGDLLVINVEKEGKFYSNTLNSTDVENLTENWKLSVDGLLSVIHDSSIRIIGNTLYITYNIVYSSHISNVSDTFKIELNEYLVKSATHK
jgi:hypothetical protein